MATRSPSRRRSWGCATVVHDEWFVSLRANLTINNLLNSDWREAQFADTSAVTPTSPAVEQMHFTSGIPLTATATAAYQF